MNNTHDVVLQLLKVALGNSNFVDYDASKVDWNDVMIYAFNQGVNGVAFGALEKLPLANRPGKDEVLQWYGQTYCMENQYKKYENSIIHLCAFLEKHNIKPMIMKGYGCSLNYPVPYYRPCGDIDIWLFGKQKEADKLFESKGVNVTYDNDHHSVFKFGGFIVENHQTIMDANKHKSNAYVNKLLEEEAPKDLRVIDVGDAKVYLPSDRFYAIHLLRHMASDFAQVKTSLRHVLDWATFVSKYDVDWTFVHEVAKNANMNKFLDALNGICVEYLGYPTSMFPVEDKNEKLEIRVLNDILTNTDERDDPGTNISLCNNIIYGLHKSIRMWRNRWKHEIVFNESLLDSFIWRAKNRLVENSK